MYSLKFDQIGFSFCEFKDDHWCSRINFSLFSQQNLTFKHSSDVKMILEVNETRDSRSVVSR